MKIKDAIKELHKHDQDSELCVSIWFADGPSYYRVHAPVSGQVIQGTSNHGETVGVALFADNCEAHQFRGMQPRAIAPTA